MVKGLCGVVCEVFLARRATNGGGTSLISGEGAVGNASGANRRCGDWFVQRRGQWCDQCVVVTGLVWVVVGSGVSVVVWSGVEVGSDVDFNDAVRAGRWLSWAVVALSGFWLG